jgi:hypothetical protein
MTTLSDALASLADTAIAAPTSVEVIRLRADELRGRRRLRRLAAVGALALAVTAPIALRAARPDPGINVVASNAAEVRDAGYVAVAPGGYRGRGDWSLTIIRGPNTIRLRSGLGHGCAPTGTIQPGDRVYGRVVGAGSLLRVGETAHCEKHS